MSLAESHPRYEELGAGRAMGDLSLEEDRELELLGEEFGREVDIDFEILATALDLASLRGLTEPMPAALMARLEKQADALVTPELGKIVTPEVSVWQRVVRSPLTGWAAAAAVALMAWAGSHKSTDVENPMSVTRLRAEATDVIEREFKGVGDFASASGKVIWSDQLQQGFMTLDGIPGNDPQRAQYQLWIVDPKRDEAPVDGGVFDIPGDGSPVIIPISAKLALTDPQAFVITLEQPGGVVKSKQEKVVAVSQG